MDRKINHNPPEKKGLSKEDLDMPNYIFLGRKNKQTEYLD